MYQCKNIQPEKPWEPVRLTNLQVGTIRKQDEKPELSEFHNSKKALEGLMFNKSERDFDILISFFCIWAT